ncbi:MAG: hypothetical protein ACRDZR_13700 [Acidimicrobiales bacterium]
MISSVHPLAGQVLEAKTFKRRSGALFLVVLLPDGSPGTIPADATDIFGEGSPVGPVTTLTVEGVRCLRALVGSMTPAGPSPGRPKTRK